MTNTTPTFSRWLKQRRKVLGLTQKELAQQAGCAEVTVRKIETGDLPPSTQLAAALAKAVGASEADLPGLVALARGADEDFTAKARLLRPKRPNNLTAQLTPLIGRQHDIAAVRKRLLTDGARLITLLGPPGVGKTRLALAVAEDVLEQFEHGVFFVRLAPIGDPALVATAIAQALDLQLTGSTPPAQRLRAYLEEKHLLLVLDNFEHLVEAAPLIDDLLRRCPWLHVLVTSRQPLRVRGERQVTVRSLALPIKPPGASRPTAEDVLRYSAVALFAERAEAVQHDFAVTDANASAVAELCRRLDGLPLAIELVAARIKLLPPAELVARLRGPWLLSMDGLRDVSARQKTLRGAIDWSYDLLTPVEQTLFTHLAVFAGGCTLEAAEMLCEDVLSQAQVLDGIASLLNKSLLHRETGMYGESRYAMLETVREYGWERLALNGEEETVRARHLSCFLRLIESAEQTTHAPGWVRIRQLMNDDLHNVRAALAWAIHHDVQAALLLTAALLERFMTRGPYAEGRRLIDDVFTLPGASARTIARAKALYKAGTLLLHDQDLGQAQSCLEEGLVLSQELGYGQGVADALLGLGRIVNNSGQNQQDQDVARRYFERALAHYRLLGDAAGIAKIQVLLGQIHRDLGDFPLARALCEESLAVAQQAGFSWAWPLVTLCGMAIAEGNLNGAQSLGEQALEILSRQGSPAMMAYTLRDLGSIATRRGDFTAAHAYLEEAQVVMMKLGSKHGSFIFYLDLADLFQAEGEHHRAIEIYRRYCAGVLSVPDQWGALLVSLAALAETLGRHELAAKLLSTTVAIENATGYRLYPDTRDTFSRIANEIRAHLSAEQFDAAWTEGGTLGFEQAANEAVSILEGVVGTQSQATTAAGASETTGQPGRQNTGATHTTSLTSHVGHIA